MTTPQIITLVAYAIIIIASIGTIWLSISTVRYSRRATAFWKITERYNAFTRDVRQYGLTEELLAEKRRIDADHAKLKRK